MKKFATYASMATLMLAAGAASAAIQNVQGTVTYVQTANSTGNINGLINYVVSGTWDDANNDLNLTFSSDVDAWFPGADSVSQPTPNAEYTVDGVMTYVHGFSGGTVPNQTWVTDNDISTCVPTAGTDICSFVDAPSTFLVIPAFGVGGLGEMNLVATATTLNFDFQHNYDAQDAKFVATFDLAVSQVPVPAAAWLFGSALVGLAGVGRSRKVK